MLQPISTEEFARLKALARKGNPDALAELAETYRMGRVVGHASIEPNQEFAERLWKKAAKAGNPRARERRRIRRSLRYEQGVSKAFDVFRRWVRDIGIGVTIGVAVGIPAYQSLLWYRTSAWPPIRVLEGIRWVGIDTDALPATAADGLHPILVSILEVPLALVLLVLGLILTGLLVRLTGLLRPSRSD